MTSWVILCSVLHEVLGVLLATEQDFSVRICLLLQAVTNQSISFFRQLKLVGTQLILLISLVGAF